MRDLDLFYNREALELAVWAYEVLDQDRHKAHRIMKVAHSVEERWQNHHQDIVNSRYCKPMGASLTFMIRHSPAPVKALQ